jgi:hypothetical protein
MASLVQAAVEATPADILKDHPKPGMLRKSMLI